MRIVRMIVGMLLLTAGLPILLAAGGLWTVAQHRDAGGAFRAELETLDVPGRALIIEDLDGLLRRDAAFARAGRSELRVTARVGDEPAFIGLAPADAATDFLRTARHTRFEHLALTKGPLPVRVSAVPGVAGATDGGSPEFWTRSGDGDLRWTADEVRDREVALVIMSADGRPAGPVTVTAELRPDWLTAATWGGLGGGLLLIIVGMAVLAWPSRPRELVYVVDHGALPDLAARLGSRASIIRQGDNGMVITDAAGRPVRGGRTATLLAEHGAAADAGPGSSAGAAGDMVVGREAAVGHGGAGDAAVGDDAGTRPATLADVPRPDAAGAEGIAGQGDTRTGPVAGADSAGSTVPAADTTARPKGRTRARPPATPQLTWPPLRRDPAEGTQPPIYADTVGASGVAASAVVRDGAVAVPDAMPTASAAAAEALEAHAGGVQEARAAGAPGEHAAGMPGEYAAGAPGERVAGAPREHAAEAPQATTAGTAEAHTAEAPPVGVREARLAGVPEARPAAPSENATGTGAGGVATAAGAETRETATAAGVESGGTATADAGSPRKRATTPATRKPAKRASATGGKAEGPADAATAPDDRAPLTAAVPLAAGPVKRQPRRAAAAVTEDSTDDAPAATPAPRVGRRRKPEPAAE